jgi:hypothetical protein
MVTSAVTSTTHPLSTAAHLAEIGPLIPRDATASLAVLLFPPEHPAERHAHPAA